ncbi:MAG: ABC transporter permease [Polyangiaceae bacterium]|jgi:putative ABC transport system permease protein|nr:ABC transporter permease [Polyangiaceae bacterium]
MSFFQIFRVALRALFRNKMRSFLTMLGIIIGVAAVIAMVAIGEGAKAQVEAAFASMGTNLLILMPGSTSSGGVQGGFGSQPTLTWDDLRAIQTELSSVKAASPQLRMNGQILAEEGNWSSTIYGVSPEYFDIRSWKMASGERFSAADVEASNKVLILGQTVVSRLFGEGADPVGQTVRVRNIPFVVVAVMERKGQSAQGQDYDDAVFMPYTTFRGKLQGGLRKYLSGVVFIGATSADATARAEKDIAALLRDRHNLPPGEPDDFSVRNLSEIAEAQQEGTRTLTTLLASIAAVSLLVGGIGIMNIMLVSVTERTREVGLRMAIGARRRDILAQFLTEALVLSAIGGLLGVGIGLLVAQQLASRFGWQTLVRPDIVLTSVVFSGVVGIVFGLYPARKAASLDPIEALRFE